MDTQELQKLKNKYDIIGNDASLNRALEIALAIAPRDLTVLITGESGVGKDIIPRIIHQNSPRKTGKYLPINCGGLPEGTINSELFGHEKGSFTGATDNRKGYFEEANGGTIFLDEVGELPASTQAMLLRVLETGEYMKVGSSKVEKTDVRVIAATNVNLPYAVAQGKFREDLYYRLNTIQIKMPALRERKEDIYLLWRKFTADFSEKYNLCKVALNVDAISMLTSYRWPGNIRQLKNVAETVASLESKPVTPLSEKVELNAEALAKYIPNEKDTMIPATSTLSGSGMSESDKQMIIKALLDLKQEVDDLRRQVEGGFQAVPATPRIVETTKAESEPENPVAPSAEDFSIKKANDDLIEKALAKHGGKVKPAAEELGISERTIYRKLAERKTK